MTPSAHPASDAAVAARPPEPGTIAPASSAASLLVAALVMLHHPCPRNTATARLLLGRAAGHAALAPAEREACRNLADDLDSEHPAGPVANRQAVNRRGILAANGSVPSHERLDAKGDFTIHVPGRRCRPGSAARRSPTEVVEVR